MPPEAQQSPDKTLQDVVDALDLYPIEAFDFVNEGLAYAIAQTHGERKTRDQNMHISGQQLCEGLRDYAVLKYGMLAGTVLRRWGVTRTFDFGKMVFAMIDGGIMSKTESDNIDDFKNVFDFKQAFDREYVIPDKS